MGVLFTHFNYRLLHRLERLEKVLDVSCKIADFGFFDPEADGTGMPAAVRYGEVEQDAPEVDAGDLARGSDPELHEIRYLVHVVIRRQSDGSGFLREEVSDRLDNLDEETVV